ncbi:MAG: transglutaminase family protein [Pseudomonadales bacterium]|nr:transglutaminase family protein [Pseudomonadales bacterium]
MAAQKQMTFLAKSNATQVQSKESGVLQVEDASAYLRTSTMIDFQHPAIQQLVNDKGWRNLNEYEAIGEVYYFVRDTIKFGYNRDDTLKASEVLHDGYGQCNTKGTLLMALFRAIGVPARFHGFTIDNQLQKGAIPKYLFLFAPERIIHSWVEIFFEGQWLDIEGYIIDQRYLAQIQARFANQCDGFSGYGIATNCLAKPSNEWRGQSNYIQRDGIVDDFGTYVDPDSFYGQIGTNLRGIKKWLFRYVLRHLMNRNVRCIRKRGLK